METKQRILNTAESLFMRYGLKSVTMDDVSRELGISKKTLYQFVENKKDLINAVIAATIQSEKEVMDQIQAESTNAIDEMLRIARHVTQKLREFHPGAVYDLQKYYREAWDLMNAFHEHYIFSTIKGNIERGQTEGLYRSDANSEIIARLYVGKTFDLVDESNFPLARYNRQKLFQEYILYHLRGIASTKGLKLLEKHCQ